jgi:endonuclease YncB( thermonuclease family)
MTTHDDNLIFDRLADGELTNAERQALLASLDSRADGWRRCALALLEAQTWRRDFKSFVTQESPPTVVQVEAVVPPELPARPMKTSSTRRSADRWFALAASALVAFGVGWGVRGSDSDQPLNEQLAGENAVPQQLAAPAQLDSRDAVTLLVKDDQGKHQRLRLPLVDGPELEGQLVDISPEARASLQNRGFDLQSKRRYAPLFFEHNKQVVPMVVPVNDTYIVPVNRPVY